MKKTKILLAFGLACVGVALVVPWSYHRDGSASPISSAAMPPASTPVPGGAQKQQSASPAQAGNADDQAIRVMSDLNRDAAAQYQKAQLDAQRNREQWQQRWKYDTEKFKAEQAAIDLKIHESEQEAAATDAKIRKILSDAKAENEREKRDQAARASAAATAPPPTPPQQGATNF